jgi:hypothetical protein
VIGETKKGQLAPLKYLFEMASIYPPAPDGSQATTEEDCLAKILLDGLNIPIKPAAEKTDETSEAARTGEPAVNGDESDNPEDGIKTEGEAAEPVKEELVTE